jgi:hypothetical protein
VVLGFATELIAGPLPGVDQPLKHASGVLVFLGLFSLLGCVAMLMRTGMAKGSGEPIPDDPSADVLTKTGRSIARGERNRAPIYRGMWQLFLGLGVALVVVGFILLAAAYL